MREKGVESIKTLAQRIMDRGPAGGEGPVRFSAAIEVTESSPDVLKALGSFTANERGVIIGRVFETLQDRIQDIIAARCLLKSDALKRESVKKRVVALRYRKRKAVRKNENRRIKKDSLPDPSE